MVNYGLSLKLKLAGLSQMRMGDFYITPDILIRRKDINTALFDTKGDIINIIDLVYRPTLEELIEACGKHIESIIQRGNGEGDNWESRDRNYRFNATTLEEAIANLYLQINGK